MASVCGGSLALFDAGVPLGGAVAGVAMGLIKGEDGFAVLSDIAGQEDHYGDMDFKVAGTRRGITALQMDIKLAGVTREIMQQALAQAREGRLHILDEMERCVAEPRGEISPYAPRLFTMQIPKDKIRDVIGPGGKTIRSITEETGCEIEIADDGKVTVASPDSVAAQRAMEIIGRLTEVPEIGKHYRGIVRRVEDYGAFVEILPGTDGLLHVSELAPYRVRAAGDVVREGDEVEVKVISMDDNRVRLSRKAVIMAAPDYDPKQFEGMGYDGPLPARGERGDRERGPRRGDRGRGGPGRGRREGGRGR
jgi:polyribonucleotide nucleotidyltransferase